MYFLSLGCNAINIQFLVREIVDGLPNTIKDNKAVAKPSARAIALSGRVESVDRFLTFMGIGLLSALSDKFGRKPLMAWSAIGFMVTNFIQAHTKKSTSLLYLADFVDGCSSCMLPLCQAYLTDVSPQSKLAGNLGIFQGLSAGGAFIFAFPIAGILGAKYGPRLPLYVAAAIQLLNALIIIFITPESNTTPTNAVLDWTQDNPMGGMRRLFGHASILRNASAAYFLTCLARTSLDAQFSNYTNLRFGWTQAQSGPVLLLVGFMLAIAPRLLVPRLGLRKSIVSGLLVFAVGLTASGLAPTPAGFVASIFVVSIGCVCIPALQALLVNLAPPGERGALLGAVGALNELTGAIGSTLYAGILATFTADNAPLPIPGMQFVVGGVLLLLAWAISWQGLMLSHNKDYPALDMKKDAISE